MTARAGGWRIHTHHRLMGLTSTASDLLPGTLELLILKALVSGAKHGSAEQAEFDRMVGLIQQVLRST